MTEPHPEPVPDRGELPPRDREPGDREPGHANTRDLQPGDREPGGGDPGTGDARAGDSGGEDFRAGDAGGRGAFSRNAFHGPTALQVGDHNTQYIHHHITSAAPPAPLAATAPITPIAPVAAPADPLDATADEFARVVGAQWQEEAGLRRLLEPAPLPVRWRVSERKVAGRVVGATGEGAGRARFAPVPGLGPATREQLRDGGGLSELHSVYGGLASGRLLLVGAPAAGKTAAAVLLLLDALVHRAARAAPADRARVPVPVLLSLDGWNPGEDTAVDWAADRLCREYTLFHGRAGRARARQLLEQGRVSLFLDGLDEVTGRLRGAMVSALETAPFRLVLVSRAREAVLTAKKARLGGALAVEIQPVRPADAAGYLLNRLPSTPSPAWQELTGRLLTETGPHTAAPHTAGPLAAGPLAAALAGPLAVALLRDVYGDDDPVDELLDTARFPTPAAIENHLLDHAVAAAYTRRPGHPRPRYSPETAERTLRHIARRLTRENSRDLRWWHIPGWTRHRPRTLAVWIFATVVCGTPGVLMALSLYPTLLVGVTASLGAIGGGYAVARRITELSVPQPLSSAGRRDIFTRETVGSGVAQWLFVGTALVLLVPLLVDDPPPHWFWYLVTLPMGFGEVLATGRGYDILARAPFLSVGTGRYDKVREGFARPPVVDTRSVSPRDVWRHHLGLRLFLGLLTGFALALYIGPMVAWSTSWLRGAEFALTAFLWTGATSVAGNLAVATALAALQLHHREGTPVRLMRFLEDARRRNLLRATGPVYQFRHALLQERLAEGADEE
ncbi:hypothetical protein J2X68_000236 [Streptomyces sp. 3330]|uniref:hypothetical protein n=1 Tax=Streptomyces sp. 3330 TaxID=2817755 RepID=UPI0028633899|nr:hypothetical protein [Streptomyces sp. 3330]MDR6973567.1 hypothetical protein [Streptomyces sp. 3330]